MIRTKIIAKLPKCDFCDNKAAYDTKTTSGPWGYTCEKCFPIHGNPYLATKLRTPNTNKKKITTIPKGTLLTSMEEMIFDSVCEWECPHCGYAKTLEIDASGTVECDDCGNPFKVQGTF